MYSEAELKPLLQSIASQEYAPPDGEDVFALAQAMLAHLGSPDAELRDDLIYGTLARWILRQQRFESEALRQLLWQLADDDHLGYGLGQAGDDSVFRRSFSVLLWPPVLIVERQRPFLSAAETQTLKERMAHYLRSEQDHRGYVPGKGWAHAAAHAADALDDLVQCAQLHPSDLLELLDAAAASIAFAPMPHLYEEDERMTTAVFSALGRQLLPEQQVVAWLQRLAARALEPAEAGSSFVHFNVKAFLRSFAFRARRHALPAALLAASEAALAEIDHFKNV